jgi:hypothetical protein
MKKVIFIPPNVCFRWNNDLASSQAHNCRRNLENYLLRLETDAQPRAASNNRGHAIKYWIDFEQISEEEWIKRNLKSIKVDYQIKD